MLQLKIKYISGKHFLPEFNNNYFYLQHKYWQSTETNVTSKSNILINILTTGLQQKFQMLIKIKLHLQTFEVEQEELLKCRLTEQVCHC